VTYRLSCAECGRTYQIGEVRYRCDCGAPLEIQRDAESTVAVSRELFDRRLAGNHNAGLPPSFASSGPIDERGALWAANSRPSSTSGVWRFWELLPPIAEQHIISRPEGNTNLYSVGASEAGGFRKIGEYAGLQRLYLKHEGENPTGSFKDRGMTVGVSQAVAVGASAVACASTGNTSSSLASYAAQAGIPCFVFVPEGKIASGKLAQTLAYGAVTLQIRGDFDAAMGLVQEVCERLSIYLVNSVNPFRIEGQKTIAFELLQQLGWETPDWIVLPAGNLGNTAALGKALVEARAAGLIDRLPRLAPVQAEGANPFYRSFTSGFAERFTVAADTVATAIKIGNPVSYERARNAVGTTGGVVAQVTDAEILEAKAIIDRAGIGCEPASAAALAGARRLAASGVIDPAAQVAAILTGHVLKDTDTTVAYHLGPGSERSPYANRPIVLDATFDAVRQALETYL
jgi:threonine synthase